ncbi:hypothetical protein [Lapillicoccus jejuensis]|uniref:Uncharacterized protein n=1 Tax=Lapillicoccus jejuensis TaxID=402171 RepID=A0A542E5Y6_9MICO|nr:hypothetical protein [Lapillicoccus jejuensis]TQJ10748.1 hypothetical protein FB458_3885 [Lapillicoccus jejuensis]
MDQADDLAERLRDLALGVPGVVSLYPGTFGEIATYLPSRRVAGIRVLPDAVHIHVCAVKGVRTGQVADSIADRLEPEAQRRVIVWFEEDAFPGPE